MKEIKGRYPWIEDEEEVEDDSEDMDFHEQIKEFFKSFADEIYEF